MCIAAWITPKDGPYAFIYISNRDEFLDRPTSRLSAIPTSHGRDTILAGQDLRGGGTWLGARRDGRFAALTNYRLDQAEGEMDHAMAGSSRGTLVMDALSFGEPSAKTACARAASEGVSYSGFSMMVGDMAMDPPSIHLTSNHGTMREKVFPTMTPGQGYILSNADLDRDEGWPKVPYLREAFTSVVARASKSPQADLPALSEELFSLMSTHAPEGDGEVTNIMNLRSRVNIPICRIGTWDTVLPKGWYATRATTMYVVLRAKSPGEAPVICMIERANHPGPGEEQDVCFVWRAGEGTWPPPSLSAIPKDLE